MARIAGEIKMTDVDFEEVRPKIIELLFQKALVEQLDNTGSTTMFAFDIEEDNADVFGIMGPVLDVMVSKKTEDSIDEALVLGRERQNIFMRQGWWTKLSKDEQLERALMVKGKIFSKFIEKCEKDKTSPAEVLSNLMMMTIFSGTADIEKYNEKDLENADGKRPLKKPVKKKK